MTASDPDAPKLAVALRYDAPHAPQVVATGRGDVADAILETARAAGVPIEENPMLAQALSKLELDEEIPEALYKAVASIIAAILRAEAKAAWRT